MKVLHVTSVHGPFDSRIFAKECRSLAAAGLEVVLAAPAEFVSQKSDGVRLVGLPRARQRRERLRTWREIPALIACEQPGVVHFHDPELIPLMMLFAGRGRHVIYDVHEDVPKQVLGKHWIPSYLRGPVSRLMRALERSCERKCTLVLATESLQQHLLRTHPVVHNYVDLTWFDSVQQRASRKRGARHLVYCGGVSRDRGVFEMLQALALLPSGDVTLSIVGALETPQLHDDIVAEIARLGLEGAVELTGLLPASQAIAIVKAAAIGLCVLHPAPSYIEAFPIKLAEYMAAGIPVIASDFPLWHQIIEGNACGAVVNPLDVPSIAAILRELLDHPARAKELGSNGRRAVEQHYNWGSEEAKLFRLYETLAS